MKVHLEWWQFLSPQDLLQAPATSLMLLHQQPPLLNLILAILLHIEQYLGIPLGTSSSVLFRLISFCLILLLYDLGWVLTRSRAVATIGALAVVLNPALLFHEQIFFYTPLESLFLAGAACFLMRWRVHGRDLWLAPVFGSIGLLVLARSLWHPLYFLAIVGVVLVFSFRSGNRGDWWKRPLAAGGLAFLLLIAPWMAKNFVLFNTTGFSSWLGFNMGGQRITGFMANRSVEKSVTEAELSAYYAPWQLELFERHPVVAAPNRTLPGSSRTPINLNHYMIPVLSKIDVAETVRLWRRNPRVLLKRVELHFFSLDVPPYCGPYGMEPLVGTYPYPSKYAKVHDFLIYGGWLKQHAVFDWFGGKRRFSLFVLLLVPVFFAANLAALLSARSRDLPLLAAFLLLTAVWFLAIILLIDGRESMRMRWSLEPIATVGLLCMLYRARKRLTMAMFSLTGGLSSTLPGGVDRPQDPQDKARTQ